MLRKIGIVLFMTIALVGCSKENDDNSNSMIVKENTIVTLVEHNEGTLISFEYHLKNSSNEFIGPFFINYVFYGDMIQQYLDRDEYSSYKIMGGPGIQLKPSETYQGGDNIEIIDVIAEPKQLQDEITNNNTIEIQIIDINTEEIVESQWINNFRYVNQINK
ncbi:MAG TPA: hypothetical protein IAA29_11040 [Candidatus Paenibacillus intestinavium]|nr:hypothetical protein [Candidatus Paenibacillus intestinavium]